MAASILSPSRSSCRVPAATSDTVPSSPWVQLVVLNVMFSSSIGSTGSWPNRRQNGDDRVVCLTVFRSAQSIAGRWSIHISFSSSEQAVSLDSASAIGLVLVRLPY